MLKINVKSDSKEYSIFLDVDDPNKYGKLIYDDYLVFGWEFNNFISESYGAFGHILNPKSITPIDLHAALVKGNYKFEILEGEDMIKVYDPKIPDGAMT